VTTTVIGRRRVTLTALTTQTMMIVVGRDLLE
jgi:hypothetical protein